MFFEACVFALGSRQLKSPFCLAVGRIIWNSLSLSFHFFLYLIKRISFAPIALKRTITGSGGNQRISQCLRSRYVFKYVSLCLRINIKGLLDMSAYSTIKANHSIWFNGWFSILIHTLKKRKANKPFVERERKKNV